MRRAAAPLAMAVGLALAAACGHDHTAPPDQVQVPDVVAEPASAFASVTVSSGDRSVELSDAQRRSVAPLRAARLLPDPDAAAAYGLDQPVARLTYRRRSDAAPLVVELGTVTFDARARYARVAGDTRVFTILSEVAEPLLAVVGQPT